MHIYVIPYIKKIQVNGMHSQSVKALIQKFNKTSYFQTLLHRKIKNGNNKSF